MVKQISLKLRVGPGAAHDDSDEWAIVRSIPEQFRLTCSGADFSGRNEP